MICALGRTPADLTSFAPPGASRVSAILESRSALEIRDEVVLSAEAAEVATFGLSPSQRVAVGALAAFSLLGVPAVAVAATRSAPAPAVVKVQSTRARVEGLLEAAAKRHGVPSNILKAVAWQESRWNPKARSHDGGHGKGVMQIDDRWHAFARTPAVFDPARNIDYGARYLADLHRQTGSWKGALTRYNGSSAYARHVLKMAEQQPWR